MQDLPPIEIIQQRLTFQQTEINQILKNMRHLSEIFSIPAENANSLRCLHIQEIHTKFKTFFILFADRIRLAYAELQSLAAKIAEHKLSNDSMLKDLAKLTADLKQSVSNVGSLMSYQIVIQSYTQLVDTAQEKLFFDNLSKSLRTEMTEKYKETFLSRVARLLTLHFTQLLHTLSDEGLKNLAKETALKLTNYLLSNSHNISSLSNQGIIDVVLTAKGTKGFIEDGRDVQLISGKKVNSESLFWVPQQWPSHLAKDLPKAYTDSQNCGSDAFNKQFLADLHQTGDALRQLSIGITVLKHNVLRSINEISPKTPVKPRINQIEVSHNIILHKTTRDELEDYAREHRCDDLNAKGSFREYIQKLHYPHITDLNLIQIDAKNLNLASTNLMKADLSYCDFTGSNFNQATLYQANLSHAILGGVNFQYTVLDQAIFSQTEQQNKHTAVLSNILKLQKQIHSELSKIKEARGLRKSEDCAVFMKLIEDFFDEAFLLFNSQNLLTAENSHIISCLAEFCQAYLDAGVIVLKRSLAGSLQANQALIRDFIIKAQAKLKQWSELGSLEKCVINLESVDLVRLNLSGLSFQQVKVTEEQLIKMDGIKMIQHIDPEKLQRAVVQKFKIAKKMLEQAIAMVKLLELSIQACEYFNHFACNGKMPDISAIPEDALKLCVLLMLRSQEINILDQKHPLNMFKVSDISDAKYMAKALSEVKNDLHALLAARNYDLGSDLTATIKDSKLSRFYTAIGDTFIKIGDVEDICLSDMDTAQAEELTHLVDELKQLRRHYSREEKIKLTQADQECVNHLLMNLHRVSSYSNDTAKDRLANAEAILKANPEVVMDLRPYPDLKQELIQNLNVATPQLILSHDQFHFILTKKQQLARSDAFQEAIKSGDITQVKAWLKAGVDVNAKATDRRTPLKDACFHGFVDIARLLLEFQATYSAPTQQNISSIDALCLLKDRTPEQMAVMDLLKEYGVTPNFHSLIAIGDIAAVQKAITVDKVNVDKSLRGDSPLHFAAKFGQIEITALLLANGANPSLRNVENQLPIGVACWHGHVEIVCLLLSMDDDINQYKDSQGHGLLYHAAKQGFTELVNLLIQYGAIVDLDCAILLSRYDDIKATMDEGDSLLSLLHKAIKLGAEKTALHFIETGADILSPCENKLPLELACENGQTSVVAMLLKQSGAQALLMMQQCKKSPLFVAVSKNFIDIVRLLLTAGINPDAIDPSLGRTCLHQAAKDKNFPMAELLIRHGASVGIKDKRGYLPIHWAAEQGDEPMCILLIQGYFEAQTSNKKTVRGLLPKEVNPRLFALLTVPSLPAVPQPDNSIKLCPDTKMNFEIFGYILSFIFKGCSAIQQKESAQSLLLVSRTWCGFYQQYKTENDKSRVEKQDDLEAFNDRLLDAGIAQSLNPSFLQ